MEEKRTTIKRMHDWLQRYERPISSVSLVGGFVFNALVLKRVDAFWDNFWVAIHLLLVAICILLINRQESEGEEAVMLSKDPATLHFWLVNILQFFFGGLLSTFIVFYFRSAVLAVTWPFFLVLLVAFIANESFKRQYTRLVFQIGFFFLCTLLFMIFLVPILLLETNSVVFLMSGGISLIVLLLFLGLLRFFAKKRFKKSKDMLIGVIVGIYIVVNGLYFLHLIPPLPLSLQDAGIYHSVVRTNDGNYEVTREEESFKDKVYKLFSMYPTYHTTPSTRVYAYSSIFSPDAFNSDIMHEWQEYDAVKKTWITRAKMNLKVPGGRENGFRTYSINFGLETGKWRVNVKTAEGQHIGRMVFDVIIVPETPELLTVVKK